MHITLQLPVLEKLNHAALAAHRSNHLDGSAHRDLVDQLGDRVAPDVQGRTEPVGNPPALPTHDDAVGPDDSEPNDGTQTVTASVGDAS